MDIEKIWGDAPWELGMSYMSRGGVIGRAIGALDQALWDIKGQYANLPIYRLLGGASPGSVRAYTTWGFNVYTKEELVESAIKAVQDRGHNPLKYQAVAADRGQNVMVDAERLRAVREAVPPVAFGPALLFSSLHPASLACPKAGDSDVRPVRNRVPAPTFEPTLLLRRLPDGGRCRAEGSQVSRRSWQGMGEGRSGWTTESELEGRCGFVQGVPQQGRAEARQAPAMFEVWHNRSSVHLRLGQLDRQLPRPRRLRSDVSALSSAVRP